MDIYKNKKLITCVIPKGKAMDIVKHLHERDGIHTANVSSGRGQGVVESISFKGWYEVEILTVVVSEDRADEIFSLLYEKADIGHVHGGIMYQGGLTQSTRFSLPEIPQEGQETDK